MSSSRLIHNEDVHELLVEIPEGHRHLRTRVLLSDGTELVFQEAAISNLIRAFLSVKTHPTRKLCRLKGRRVSGAKKGYADWQLLEEEP